MLFLTSLLYALVGFWIGIWAVAPIQMQWPLIPSVLVIFGVHAVIYAVIGMTVRVTLHFWRDENADQLPSRERLQMWLDVRGCRWLNIAGIVAVGLASLWLATHGGLSWHGWMLVCGCRFGFARFTCASACHCTSGGITAFTVSRISVPTRTRERGLLSMAQVVLS